MSEIIAEQPTQAQGSGRERRRPGRRSHASPELIGMLRVPSAAAEWDITRYDAAAAFIPDEPSSGSTLDLLHFTSIAAAAGFCVLGWLTALQLTLAVLR